MPQDPTPTHQGPQKPADDFLDLLPAHTAISESDERRPLYYLWVFDPVTGRAHIDHNEGRHRAHTLTHKDIAPEVNHPDRLNGMAYRIQNGWRICDVEARPVKDTFIVDAIKRALNHEEPPKPLPHIKTHYLDFLNAKTHYGRLMQQVEEPSQ